MSTVVLLTVTGLGLGALYFLVASGLSLIFGLMGVLNFAHGAFFTVGGYASWWFLGSLGFIESQTLRFAAAAVCGLAIGAAVAALVEVTVIRALYGRHVDQILATVGLSLAVPALIQGIWGADPRTFPTPSFVNGSVRMLGVSLPNDRFLVIGAAVVTLVALVLFLRKTRYGLIIRAGVENRTMVSALGIDVGRSFTLVFAIGGLAAALAGILGGAYFGSVDPLQGTELLIFAFIVVIIGGLGSLAGSAVAAVMVGLVQQYLNFYASAGIGDLAVVLLLALVLLARPQGLFGRVA